MANESPIYDIATATSRNTIARSPNSGQQTATRRPSSSGSYSTCQSSSNRDISRYCFRLGDSGTLIENLVEDLRVAGYYEGRTTNRFDSKVEQAVKRFQQDYRYIEAMSVLAVDGIVGPDTLLRLCQATRRGCGPNAGLECYQGSPIGVIGCLERYNQYVATERSPSRNEQSTAERSPNSGQQTAAGRSLLVAANAQSIRGVTVPPAEKSPSRLADGYGFFLDKPNAITLDDGTLVYSFDVYNLGYADGVIEVYDSRNKLIEVRGIEGFRNPATNLYAFPVEGVNRLFRLATEGYGILDLRNAFGRAKKTEIRNIAIPRGGRLIFTKNSEGSMRYNQATFVMAVLADSVLSKFPSGDNATLKTNILSSLFIELQKERVGSLLRDGMLLTAQDSRRAFANQSWIEEQNLSKLMEIGSKVLAQELLKYGV
ncbi:peptidoglycan-binding domain-containing protein [Microseira wollei]|uniref:Peptidoglycan binding domain-containing protein n=1 Tax=Microseira wollei NIES-4236 TaxID=2530354 RepID=A0AAV3X591_9CYAN|nr:peptidoglycan-binding domain-containing protein [Microseira wollei]GET36411.1 peptidoglycan binding domain-containing protein [Microseira wollei NIES-4236]